MGRILIWLIAIFILTACSSEDTNIRKPLSDNELSNIQYLYPEFKEQQFIHYNRSFSDDQEIILSEDVSWSDVYVGYKHQLENLEKQIEFVEKVTNDYYKGRIVGDEVNKAGLSLISIMNLLDYSVILPSDSSPELKQVASNLNKELNDLKLAIYNFDLVFDNNKIIEINKSSSSLNFEREKEQFDKYFKRLYEVVEEREEVSLLTEDDIEEKESFTKEQIELLLDEMEQKIRNVKYLQAIKIFEQNEIVQDTEDGIALYYYATFKNRILGGTQGLVGFDEKEEIAKNVSPSYSGRMSKEIESELAQMSYGLFSKVVWKETYEHNQKSNVYIGMTSDEVLKSKWGKPKNINRTTTANGVREQWVYDGYNYLYFENGILTTIQN